MSRPLVSVVVPMYKVERYLGECVESLLCQSLGDSLEIVLVDDGSSDNCGAIGDSLAASHANIKCVHRSNGGLGPARNTGIANASGAYVGFVDADDWVDPVMYERLYSCITACGADVCYSGMRTVCNQRVTACFPVPFGNAVLTGDDVTGLRNRFYGARPSKEPMEPMQVSVCPAIYSRRLIIENGVEFEAIRSEDIIFNLDFLEHTNSVAMCGSVFYNYRKELQESITSSFSEKTIDQYVTLIRCIDQRLEKELASNYPAAKVRRDRRVIDCYRGMLLEISTRFDDSDRKHKLIGQLLDSEILRDAMRQYPWWRLSLKQALFFVCMKTRSRCACEALCNLKRGRS